MGNPFSTTKKYTKLGQLVIVLEAITTLVMIVDGYHTFRNRRRYQQAKR